MSIKFTADFTQAQRQLMLRAARLGKEDVMREAGEVMVDRIEPYIPKKTGKLRARSRGRVRVSPYRVDIDWSGATPYVYYQYYGEVWGPNVYSEKRGTWTSKTPKYNTHRPIGDGTSIRNRRGEVIYVRHYTTPGTGPFWDERFKADTPRYRDFRMWLTKHLQKVWERGNR